MRTLTLVLALSSVGCGGVKFVESMPMNGRVSDYETLALQTVVDDPKAFDLARKFESALVAKLTERRMFKSYVMEGKAGDVKLKTTIKAVTKSSDVGTSMGGAFRGSGKFVVECELESPSGEKLGSFSVTGKSSALGAGDGAGTTEALDVTVTKIAEYLEAHR